MIPRRCMLKSEVKSVPVDTESSVSPSIDGVTLNGAPISIGRVVGRTVVYHGKPLSIQAVDVDKLVNVARIHDCVIESAFAIGDTVIDSMPLFFVLRSNTQIEEQRLLRAVQLGNERTFKQDPKYAIRLLVDIAIRVITCYQRSDFSSAGTGPDHRSTLAFKRPATRMWNVSGSRRRVAVVPFASWSDRLSLAFKEICACGGSSFK